MKEKEVFKILKKKLVMLCTITTGSVLTLVLIAAWINSEHQWYINKKRAFEERFASLADHVRYDRLISQKQLAEWEVMDDIIIMIKDNGTPLLFRGAWKTQTDREILFHRLEEKAIENDIFLSRPLITVSEVKSETYVIKGEQDEKYFGSVLSVIKDSGYRNLMLLKPVKDFLGERIRQRWFFAVFDLIGIGALFLISWWFVGKALKPVEESRKKQTEFIAAASHELRSPLTVIRSFIQAMEFPEETGELVVTSREQIASLKRFALGIKREERRMAGLVDDMLLLASMDAKTWNLKMSKVDMDMVLIDTYDTFTPYCKEHEIQLRLELGEEMLPNVRADADRLKQILSILIHNGVSYTTKGDVLCIRAYRDGNNLIVEVADHGHGIPDDKKEAVFDRFFRGDRSRKDKKHFGLGLSIAKELTEAQNGKIYVKDTAGGGATFVIKLVCEKS